MPASPRRALRSEQACAFPNCRTENASSLSLLSRSQLDRDCFCSMTDGWPRAAESRRMVETLAGLKGSIAMLLVEHDMDVVFALADRISVLVYGRVIASGTSAEVQADPQVRAAISARETPDVARRVASGRLRLQSGSLRRIVRGRRRGVRDPSRTATAWARRRRSRPSWGLCLRGGGRVSFRWSRRYRKGAGGDCAARRWSGARRPSDIPTLTVRENLVATSADRFGRANPWTLDRVYALFPRLGERHAQWARTLSGGEQQMLAIGAH